LWNAVERREDESTRPDQAQLARDLKIALPHELNAEQRLQLVTDFAREMAARGMVVDVAIHAPDAQSDERNFHVHMLLTMREIGPDGFGKKVREWNRETELQSWKERWSELGARHLERAGFELEAERFRVGHLTLEKQREAALERGDHEAARDLNREPEKHMGPHATAMERQGIVTRNGDLNREIQERNWYAQNDRDLEEARALGTYEIERRTPTRETPRNIWEAFQESTDPRDFKEALEKRGLHLARISEDDHRNSHTYRFVAERQGKFSPLLYYGEYVAVNDNGHPYRLNLGTTGMQPHRVKEFMKPLDSDHSIPALHEVRRELENARESPDPRPTGRLGLPDRGRDVLPPRRLNRTAERAAGKMLELAASAVESFLAPVLTREQKIDGRVADHERRMAAEEAERLRRQNYRER
jgi:hypothetical protein